MKFQQVMAFFLTGATVLSMSTTALAADLPDNVDITVSTTQTATSRKQPLHQERQGPDRCRVRAEIRAAGELVVHARSPLCD